jgi:hypothetical protein
MKAAEDGRRYDAAHVLDGATDRSVFVERPMSPHERMHLTLKKETTRPPGSNSLQQQDRFDTFVHEFNTERPHEGARHEVPHGTVYGLTTPL